MRYAVILLPLVVTLGCAGQTATEEVTAASAARVGQRDEAPQGRLEDRLDEIARIASVVLDGDDCRTIVTERAARLMFKKDTRDRWAGSDNYDVNSEPFVRTKKQLIRLARLVNFQVDCNLWMVCRNQPDKMHMVIRQVNNLSQWYRFGRMEFDPPDEMKKVVETGERVAVGGAREGLVSVLAPVRTALGDVVGVVEVCARKGR